MVSKNVRLKLIDQVMEIQYNRINILLSQFDLHIPNAIDKIPDH